MGCGCGGKGATATGMTQFRLTYPDGRVQVFIHEGQAQREADRTGATMEIIHL